MNYIRCESGKKITNLSNGEGECPFCGNDLAGSDIVSERIYREYWKGIVGQPFKYNILKASTQLTFIIKGKQKGGSE